MSNLSVENIAVHNDDLPVPPRLSVRNINLNERGSTSQLELAYEARAGAHKGVEFCIQKITEVDHDNCDPKALSDGFYDLKSQMRLLKGRQKAVERLLNKNDKQCDYESYYRPIIETYRQAKDKALSVLTYLDIQFEDMSHIMYNPTITDFDYAHGYGRTSPSQCSDTSQSKRLDAAAKHAELLIKQKSAQLIQYERAQLTQAQVQAAADQAQAAADQAQVQAAAAQAQAQVQAAVIQAQASQAEIEATEVIIKVYSDPSVSPSHSFVGSEVVANPNSDLNYVGITQNIGREPVRMGSNHANHVMPNLMQRTKAALPQIYHPPQYEQTSIQSENKNSLSGGLPHSNYTLKTSHDFRMSNNVKSLNQEAVSFVPHSNIVSEGLPHSLNHYGNIHAPLHNATNVGLPHSNEPLKAAHNFRMSEGLPHSLNRYENTHVSRHNAVSGGIKHSLNPAHSSAKSLGQIPITLNEGSAHSLSKIHIPPLDNGISPPSISKNSMGISHASDNCFTKDLKSHTGSLGEKIESHSHLEAFIHQHSLLAEKLIESHLRSTLPNAPIEKFTGADPLKFMPFMRAFKHRVECKTTDPTEVLHQLISSCDDDARMLIQNCPNLDDTQIGNGLKEAKRLLHISYGDPCILSSSYQDRLEAWRPIQSGERHHLRSFAMALTDTANALHASPYANELDTNTFIRKLVSKLIPSYQEKWKVQVTRLLEGLNPRKATFKDLEEFVNRLSREQNNPQTCKLGYTSKESHTTQLNMHYTKSQEGTVLQEGFTFSEQLCPCCSSNGHGLQKCQKLIAMSQEERFHFIKKLSVCFGCLKPGHMSKQCRFRLKCKICNKNHPTILHREPEDKEVSAMPTTLNGLHIGAEPNNPLMAIVPVKVRIEGSNQVKKIYAFLDNGSNGVFITDQLKNLLQARSKEATIELKTIQGTKMTTTSLVSDSIEVTGMDPENSWKECVTLDNIYTIPSIPVNESDAPSQADIQEWAHLSEVKIPKLIGNELEGVHLMIGVNVPKAAEPLRVTACKQDGPYATLTRLGWAIYGAMRKV